MTTDAVDSDKVDSDKVDFSYQLSDERLLAYSAMPLLDRLRWLDEVGRFTLLARQAPIRQAPICQREETTAADRSPGK